jgi:predicted RNA binding protein YcfA (HicA-like mRNA interferase family)
MHWRAVERVASSQGWVFRNQNGSHINYKKEGVRDLLTIPKHNQVKRGTLRKIIRIMDLSVEEFMELATD